jgi:hypothetical protein
MVLVFPAQTKAPQLKCLDTKISQSTDHLCEPLLQDSRINSILDSPRARGCVGLLFPFISKSLNVNFLHIQLSHRKAAAIDP